MFGEATCIETISIVRAIIFGVDGACIDIGMTSVLGAMALFVASVVVLRLIGARLLRKLLGKRKNTAETELTTEARDGLDPPPYEGPIRSTGAWGGKARY